MEPQTARVAAASPATMAIELASVVAAVGLLAFLLARVVPAAGLAWWLPLAVVAGGLTADLVSGLVHWAADTWGRETWPVIGERVLRPFRVHHVNPADMLGRSFLDLNGDVALITLPILAGAILVPLDSEGGRAAAVFLTAWAAWALPTNQIHQWAHMPHPPRVVRWLQGARIVLGPVAHRVHHDAPYATHYCITTGWCNAWTARVGLFPALERAVTRITGLVPREDEWPASADSAVDLGARRPPGKARGARKSVIWKRRATPPGGMPRPRGTGESVDAGHEAR